MTEGGCRERPPPPFPSRTREARIQALKALYEADLREVSDPAEGLAGRARRYVEGAWENLADLDRCIEAVSERWPVARMAAVDRAVLRLALYELLFEKKTPAAVVLNEAVKLAKRYSTKQSGAFVNGVLAALAAQVRPGETRPR